MKLVDAAQPAGSARYQLLRVLRVGGMAEIWLGCRVLRGFRRMVVVKRMQAHLTEDPSFVAMFVDEARLMAAIHHRNVASVFDIGIDSDSYFYVMEYLDGVDLARLQHMLERTGRTMPLEQALFIALSLTDGLHAAHEARDADGRPLGVVHRDLSPSNVVVSLDGEVKIIDFGVAKSTCQRTETAPGVVKGKFAFMSPEQIQCRVLDRRSDLFSLGVVLYELTTGTRLYSGLTPSMIPHAIVEEPLIPPSAVRGDYPRVLEDVVLRALARDRARRYADAGQMRSALEQVAAHLGLAPSPWGFARYLATLGIGVPRPGTTPLRDGATDDRVGLGYYESLDLIYGPAGGITEPGSLSGPTLRFPTATTSPDLPSARRATNSERSPGRVEFRAPRGTLAPKTH